MLHRESLDWMFSEGMCCSVVQGKEAIRETRFLFRRESLEFGHTTVEMREA